MKFEKTTQGSPLIGDLKRQNTRETGAPLLVTRQKLEKASATMLLLTEQDQQHTQSNDTVLVPKGLPQNGA